MTGSLLLVLGVGGFGLGILFLAIGLLAPKPKTRGVAGALLAIDQQYGQAAIAAQRRQVASTARSRELPGWARSLALRLSPSNVGASLQRRLDLAGNPASWTADRILAAKGLCLLIGVVVGGLAGLPNPGQAILFAVILGLALFFLPDLLLYNSGNKRQAQIVRTLPDAIDLMTICVEAGLGFDAAIAQVARNTTGPLAEEFARSLQEMQIGRSRAEALHGLASRTTVPDLRSFASAVVQAGELGIPVARVLREQAVEMRVKRRQRAEEQAQKVPVKIMIPLILCIFPALFIIIIGPGIIRIAHALFGYAG